jgi:hypothetical protein
MKIRLKTLRRILSEVAEYSSLNIKPGQVLRYVGSFDPEAPTFVKVLKVVPGEAGQTIVAGDKQGKIHKISEKDLHSGSWEPAPGGMPAAKKPAPWDATR